MVYGALCWEEEEQGRRGRGSTPDERRGRPLSSSAPLSDHQSSKDIVVLSRVAYSATTQPSHPARQAEERRGERGQGAVAFREKAKWKIMAAGERPSSCPPLQPVLLGLGPALLSCISTVFSQVPDPEVRMCLFIHVFVHWLRLIIGLLLTEVCHTRSLPCL